MNLGRVDEALAAVELAAELDADEWHVPYVRACILAKDDEPDLDAIVNLLGRAIELEPSVRARLGSEPDFDGLRGDPQFQGLSAIPKG